MSTGLHLDLQAQAAQKPALSWQLFEKASRPGGHARTDETRGFFFDKTGHWLHLRDPGMKRLVKRAFARYAAAKRAGRRWRARPGCLAMAR